MRSTVTEQSTPATLSVTVTVVPASAVPLKFGVLSLMMLPELGLSIAGASGATVSTVKPTKFEVRLRFPAASVAMALAL